MDLLKDITRELRGGENESSSADGGQSRTTPAAQADSSRREPPNGAGDRTGTPDEPASDSPSTEPADRSADRSAESTGRPDESAEQRGGDVHVCSFCETEFDASDSVCPECDAEIVLRGER